MQQSPIKPPALDVSTDALVKALVIGILVVVAVLALMFSRRLIQPMDNLVTQQQCSTYGREVLSRERVASEASNRFSLINRSQGACVFGPVVEFDEDGEVIQPDPLAVETDAAAASEGGPAADAAVAEDATETIVVSLADIETSGFYRGMKWLFIALQLGAASAAVRILADPLLDRFVRRPRSSNP
jgi:hypothetical protein